MLWKRRPKTKSAEVPRGAAVGVVMPHDELFSYLKRTMNSARKFDLQGSLAGGYTIHEMGDGVELCAAYKPRPEKGDNYFEMCCSSPFFRGQSRNRVIIQEHFPNADCPYCGSLGAKLEAESPGFGLHEVQFSFAAPCFGRYVDRILPFDATVAFFAVVQSLTVYEDEAHWFSCQKDLRKKGIQIPTQYFGMGDSDKRSDRYAFSAVVKDSLQTNNAYSGLPFVWAIVESFLVTMDLLIAPELHDQKLSPGNVIFANAELVGDLVE